MADAWWETAPAPASPGTGERPVPAGEEASPRPDWLDPPTPPATDQAAEADQAPGTGTDPGDERPQLFLSHSSRDREFIDRYLRPVFDGLDVRVFYSSDLEEAPILGGEDWEARLRREMDASAWFVVVVSASALRREGYVRDEVNYWLGSYPAGDGMIPVLIDDSDHRQLHLKIGSRQLIDFREATLDAAAALERAVVATEPAKGDRAAELIRDLERPDRSLTPLVVGAVLAALVAVVAVVVLLGGGGDEGTAEAPPSTTAPASTSTELAAPSVDEPTAEGDALSFRWTDPNDGGSYAIAYQVFVDGVRTETRDLETPGDGSTEHVVDEVQLDGDVSEPVDTAAHEYCVIVRLLGEEQVQSGKACVGPQP